MSPSRLPGGPARAAASPRQPSSSSVVDAASTNNARVVRPRVWRACEICRRRKIRCDGQNPCSFCVANEKPCSFTRAEDHASLSRQRDNDTQTRLDSLEAKMNRILPLIETTHAWFLQISNAQLNLERTTLQSNCSPSSQSRNPPAPLDDVPPSSPTDNLPLSYPESSLSLINMTVDQDAVSLSNSESEERHEVDGEAARVVSQGIRTVVQEAGQSFGRVEDEHEGTRETSRTWADRLAGQLAQDSSGNFRYLGGAPTFVLAEAVDSVRQAQAPQGQDPMNSSESGPTVDHLYFRPNVHYRPLEGLPSPVTIEYPPTIISEVLVHVYFEQIHHLFPIIDKAAFLIKYRDTMQALKGGRPSGDSHFLCVLFAVYASAASLTKTVFEDRAEFQFSSPKEYIGLEFYEKALYLYWKEFRLMTIEHVTCMALLSSCLAGWNTLSQAWVLAGQAVRGAQDLGLHRSPDNATATEAVKEHRRRVWWCVFGLDKILSVSLGRPSGINDEDCDVELPSDQYCCHDADAEMERPGDNPMTGVISLLKITIIAGRIERTAHNIKFLKDYDNSADHPVVRDTIDKLDAMLDQWSATLPGSVKFAANSSGRPSMFALCLMGHFTLYACTLNLHRPFMPDLNESSPEHTYKSLERCLSAAQGCIRVGAEIKKLLPTSHHCQFCVQYLTISGITVLRCLPYVPDPIPLIAAAKRCRQLLAQLEDTWPGSKRCGSLLQGLLDACRQKGKPSNSSAMGRGSSKGHPIAAASGSSSSLMEAHRAQHRTLDFSSQPPPSNVKKRRLIATEEQVPNPTRLPQPIPTWVRDATHSKGAQIPGATAEALSLSSSALPIGPSLDTLTEPFDVSHFTDMAPFDFGDEIGALLDQLQMPDVVEPDWAQWPTWGPE